MADGSAVWIAKPSITNQATGICIFNAVGTLRAALEASEDLREWVLQRYAGPGALAAQVALCMLGALLLEACEDLRKWVLQRYTVPWPAFLCMLGQSACTSPMECQECMLGSSILACPIG